MKAFRNVAFAVFVAVFATTGGVRALAGSCDFDP